MRLMTLPVNADTVPVVPLVTAVTPNHSVPLTLFLHFRIIFILTNWANLEKECYGKSDVGG